MDRTPTVADVHRPGTPARSRRWLLRTGLTGAGAGLLLGASGPFVGALGALTQGESEEPGLDPRLAAYPRFALRLTPEKIETTTSVAAGPVVLVQENGEGAPGHAFVLRIPDDLEEAEIAAALAPDAPAAVEATPEWFWRSTFSGNPDRAAAGGGRAFALVDLTPGRYLVGDPYRPPAQYARFEAVGDDTATLAAAAPEVAVDLEVEMREMAFDMPAALPAGRHLWRIHNAGAMVHETAILPVPADATAAQVVEAFSAILAAEAAGGVFEELTAPASLGTAWAGWTPDLVAGVGITSPQHSVVAQIDLAPGSYAAVCFVPEPTTFTRHLMMGMVALFDVAR